MAKRFDLANIHRLESPERLKAMPPERTLRMLGLRRGMTFVDVGAGTGYFALPAAQLVGCEGRVFALDAQDKILDVLRTKGPPPWVETLACGDVLPLPNSVGGLVLSCFVLHEVEHGANFLRELGRVAKPYAPIQIMEWARVQQAEGPPFDERLHHHHVEALVLEAGLCLQRIEFLNASQYFVTAFSKR